MRILVVSQYFWPENFRINDLVSELCSRGHTVTVLTGQPNYPLGEIFPEFKLKPQKFKYFSQAKIVRVPIIARGKSNFRLILNYISFALSATVFGCWRIRNDCFDIIFVYQLSPITSGIPAIFLRYSKKIPVVFWILDLWPETLKAVGIIRSNKIIKLIGFLVSFIYNGCDLILCQSKSFIPKVRQYCRSEKNVAYFPSWSDTQFDFSKVIQAEEISIVEDMFNIMFAGNIGEAQDFPAILDAAEILKNEKKIRWLIIGDGRKANWVKSEIVRRELTNCFFMLGSYPLDRMPSFYAHANAMLVSLKDDPNVSMTIPGKLQSYLAAGIPVLGMLNGEGADIIRSSGAGLCCSAGDGRALAIAVKKIMAMNINEQIEIGKRGLVISKEKFDREKLITCLLSWFESVISKSQIHEKV